MRALLRISTLRALRGRIVTLAGTQLSAHGDKIRVCFALIRLRETIIDCFQKHILLAYVSFWIYWQFVSRSVFKSSVRPNELGVMSGINRSGIPWDCGAEHSFLTKLSHHLVFSVFPFPPSTVQSLGNEKNFRQNRVKLLLAPCLNMW